ncbi:MAG: glycosyltransferase, partial [bacterium]|nr:glycosyltransferase [bacterium]
MNLQRIYIVVPTFNGEKDIPLFFDTLKVVTPLGQVSVIAVDNASSDSTVLLIRSHFPEAIIIENTENRGYAGGCNQGMEYALAHGAEYVFLTNQDVRFSAHWL